MSFRLVGAQEPEKIRDAFRDFVHARLPEDARSNSAISQARRLSTSHSTIRRLTRLAPALAEEWGKKAVTVGAGGSIPIVGDFKTVLGMDTLMVGFALDDDRVHFAQRKIQSEVLSQRHPQLGGDSCGAGGVIACWAAHASMAPVFSKCAAARRSSISDVRVAANGGSFDHLVGGGEEGGREGNAEDLRGLEIEPERKPRRLLDWQYRRVLRRARSGLQARPRAVPLRRNRRRTTSSPPAVTNRGLASRQEIMRCRNAKAARRSASLVKTAEAGRNSAPRNSGAICCNARS